MEKLKKKNLLDRLTSMNPIKFLIKSIKPLKKKKNSKSFGYPQTEHTSVIWDTKSAIEELLKIAKRNTQDHEIYLALGNLYRSQGDIEKAIRLRYNLLSKPHLNSNIKGKIFYELAIDYKRGGFFDRALFFLEKAKEVLGEAPVILNELMELNALVKEFEKSIYYSKVLKNPITYAHYKVEFSKIELEKGNIKKSNTLLKEAIDAYSSTIEGWSELIKRDYEFNLWDDLYNHTKKGLKKITSEVRFVPIEAIIQHLLKKKKNDLFSPIIIKEGAEAITKALKKHETDPVLLYYLAWFYVQIKEKEKAYEALKKSVTIDPGFWLARVELVHLACDGLKGIEPFKKDLYFLLSEGRNIKRFICNICAFKTNTLFFICPRCNSWHSIRFRKYISG